MCAAILGSLYTSWGQYPRAEKLLVETVEIRERTLGAEHPETLLSQGDLANLYQVEAQHTKAEALYTKTLEAVRRKFGADHRSTSPFVTSSIVAPSKVPARLDLDRGPVHDLRQSRFNQAVGVTDRRASGAMSSGDGRRFLRRDQTSS
jgi:hypothetical protein